MNRTVAQMSLTLATAIALLGILASPAAAFAAGGSWTAPYSISRDVYGTFQMQTSHPNAAGSFISSWSEFDSGEGFYYAAIWAPAGGWQAPHKFADAPQTTLSLSVGAVANDGRALLAWHLFDAPNDRIQASVFEPLSGWSATVNISSTYASIELGAAAADSGGGLHLAWFANNSTANQGWVAYYKPVTGWGAPTLLDPGSGPLETSSPVMEDDGAGGIVAVWDRFDALTSTTWWSRWSSTTGWGPVLPLFGVQTGYFFVTASVHDLAGRAHFVFVEFPGAAANISTIDYSAASGWAAPQRVASDEVVYFFPEVACDAAGNLALVWELDQVGRNPVIAAVRPVGQAWGARAEIGVTLPPVQTGPSVAFTGGGELIAAWQYPNPLGSTLSYARHTPALGWSAPAPVPFNGAPGSLKLTSLPNSRVMMTVVASAGPWSLEYDGPDITPPALTVTSPVSGWISNVSTVPVSGTSEAGATISVNGLTTIATPAGAFSVPLALSRGDNLITVRATDASGNAVSTTLTVRFDDPSVGLAENLTAAQTQVTALQASLNATQAQLDALEANASGGGGADTTALWAQLNATRTNLTLAQTRLDEAETALSEMTSSQSQMEKQQGDLRAINVQLASQLAVLSVLAAIALLAALAAIGLLIVQARRAGAPRAAVTQAPEHDKGEPPKPPA